jgi:DNA-binding transcriptional LysR family regulator
VTVDDPWPGLELRHLVALRAVETHGSFRAAAAALGFTQGALSQQIATLERRIGKRLIERHSGARRVAPTPEGDVLLRHADAILERVAVARAAVTPDAANGTVVRAGALESVVRALFAGAFARTRAVEPTVRLEVSDARTTPRLLELIAARQLDLAVVDEDAAPEEFASDPLFIDHYVLLVGAESALASEPVVPLAQLAKLPLYTYSRDCSPTTARIEDVAASLGYPLNITMRSCEPEFLRSLVEDTGVPALVPELTVHTAGSSVAVRIDRRLPPRVLRVVTLRRSRRPPGTEAFVGSLRASALEYQVLQRKNEAARMQSR